MPPNGTVMPRAKYFVDVDLPGIVVNFAMRGSQKAAGGEFWVPSTVRGMMPGGSTTFTDRGQHALKGFEDPWRLCSVGRS